MIVSIRGKYNLEIDFDKYYFVGGVNFNSRYIVRFINVYSYRIHRKILIEGKVEGSWYPGQVYTVEKFSADRDKMFFQELDIFELIEYDLFSDK